MKVEYKVSLLFVGTICSVLLLAFAFGALGPLRSGRTLYIVYNYAGGIDEGSPVRVMGIRVGQVKKIAFDPGFRMPNGEEVKLRLTIQIDSRAWTSIRKDSKFFINLAGVIGEKFLEISPGTLTEPEFKDGDVVRGEDPPRIDQLISQSYGLAGKLIELVDSNKSSVGNVVAQLDKLVTNFNKTLILLDRTSQNKDVARLIDNAIRISDDLAYLTGQMRSKKSQETFELVHRLLFRLEDLDGPAIRDFLQKEGIKAKIF